MSKERQLEELEALKLALLNEKTNSARLALASAQRELELLAVDLQKKYTTEANPVTGFDPARGVVLLTKDEEDKPLDSAAKPS